MKLSDIQKLCDEATPGEWRWIEDPENCTKTMMTSAITVDTGTETIFVLGDRGFENVHVSPADAKFIVAARCLLPQLLAVVMAAKEQRRIADIVHGRRANTELWVRDALTEKEIIADQKLDDALKALEGG